jgi:hypothetical protein
MSLIIPANSASAAGGYAVDNSCRFDDGSNESLSKTPSSTSNRKTWTLSVWFKRCNLSALQMIFNAGSDGSNVTFVRLRSEDTLDIGSDVGGVVKYSLKTSQVFRDVSAWYNLVLAVDTTQATDSNRVKIYINGSQVTNFGTETYPTLNYDTHVNFTNLYGIGHRSAFGDWHYDGYLSEFVVIDGQQLDATSFGEFDEDSGIWKPISVSGLTFGTNGFYLDFKDSANLGNDANGGTDFTEVNLAAIDQSTDTCTNNFCTINVLDNESGNITITEGNLNYTSTGGTDETNRCTFGFTKGKWYFESKYINDANYIDVGVGSASDSDIATPRFHMEMAGYYMLQSFTSYTKVWDNGSLIATLAASAENDIHMYAIDMDNNRFYAGKNGSWYSSGDPANNSNPLISMDNGYTTLMPSVCTKGDGAASLNFGSPSYSESGGETDGDGYGNFAHAVPSGYYAINTKNLAEYG